jgi:hypothetical protein
MRILLALAALVALTAPANGQTPAAEAAPVSFNVIETDVRVPFADTRIRDYEVGRDDSLLLRAGPNRWYRATIWEPCASDLRWAFDRIYLETHPSGTLDKFSSVVVRGRRCSLRTLDRIERPAPETRY